MAIQLAPVTPWFTVLLRGLGRFLTPLMTFITGTKVGAFIVGIYLSRAVPWKAGGALTRLLTIVTSLIIGSYVILVLRSVFGEVGRK